MIKNLNKFFAKDINIFTYVLPITSFRKSDTESIPKCVALRLRRIGDSDEKYKKRSIEYQNNLISRDYEPGNVKKQFSDITNLIREEARKPKLQEAIFSTSCNLITEYNPMLPL